MGKNFNGQSIVKAAAAAAAAGISGLAAYDLTQKKHSILRSYPVVGHARYIMEAARPMVQQYFIEPDFDGRPFDRETRSAIYENAKNKDAVAGFGTERQLEEIGHETLVNSFAPVDAPAIAPRVRVGGPHCTQPYDLSLLNVSAMSYGSLSANAVRAMNKGAAKGGFAHNTGEGGLTQYHLEFDADLIWEIGSGYFGCRAEDGGMDREKFAEKARHENVKMIAIKMSQGAKPGVGGQLPKEKITKEIAEIRGIPMDQDCISPSYHKEFSTPEEMVRFCAELRELSGGKPVGIKFCVGDRVDVLGIVKAMVEMGDGPDFIDVDGGEGGTGAANRDFADYMGLPLTDGLMIVHNALKGAGIRDQVVVTAAGKIARGKDIVSRLIQGADATMSARAMMMAVGCIQAQVCHTGECPVGVATQNPRFTRSLNVQDKGDRVYHYQKNTVRHALALMASMGVTDPKDLTPSMLRRRISAAENPTYAELYTWLEDGSLIDGTAPADWLADWERARTDKFGVR